MNLKLLIFTRLGESSVICVRGEDAEGACCCNAKMHIYVDVMINVLSPDLCGEVLSRCFSIDNVKHAQT